MENVLIAIGIGLLIFAVRREITCWYFKFNAMVKLLTEIRDLMRSRPAQHL